MALISALLAFYNGGSFVTVVFTIHTLPHFTLLRLPAFIHGQASPLRIYTNVPAAFYFTLIHLIHLICLE